MADIRTVPIRLNMDQLRSLYGLTKAQLPDDAPDVAIQALFYSKGMPRAVASPAPAASASSGPLSRPDALDDAYDPSWLSSGERAAIAGGKPDDPPGTVGRLD